MMIEKTVKYFDAPGNDNTDKCLEVVKQEIEENGYKYVIVASTSGETGITFAEGLKGVDANLMVISYKDDSNHEEMSAKNKQRIIDLGATLFNSPSMDFALNRTFGTEHESMSTSHIIRGTLARFGSGVRVCCECVMAAIDGGLVAEGVEVLAVAGTDSGSDTVVVIRAAASKRFRELKVMEILAKPRS